MRITYFFSETVTNLKRNLLMTVAAISTVAISLLLLGGVQILGMTVNKMTDDWEAKVEVSAFFLPDATPNEIRTLGTEIGQMDEVQELTFVSKEEAFDEFAEDWPDLADAVPEDALPASYRVKLHDAGDAEEVAARITGAPGIDDVDYGGTVIKKLLQVNQLLRTITLVMSVILMVAAAALIANTIRLAIYARREEIGIMKLVGATNWFIRIPFMLEGLFAALVGAVVSIAIVLIANWALFSQVGNAIPFLENVFTFTGSEMLSVTAVLVGVGALVGLAGSSMALRRFLEV
jgi:cell division transport system permease protein